MADSADAEELDPFPTPHFQRPINSGIRQIKIAKNGKAVNAATDGITIGEQNIDIAGTAKEVDLADRSTRLTNMGGKNSIENHINLQCFGIGPYDSMIRPFPRDDSAAYIYNLPSLRTRSYQPTWDEAHEKFSDPRELALQRENIFTLWHDTRVRNAMNRVETALYSFCRREGLTHHSWKATSWTQIKDNIRQAGNRARNYYKRDYLLQDKMIDLIRNVNDFLASDNDLQFLGWLSWLPEDSHKHCLGDSVRYMLVAVTECYPFDRSTIVYLEKMLFLFSKSREYVRLCQERRPTADMLATTVDIFIQTAELLASLLDYSRMKTQEKGKYSKEIQTAVDRLQRTLADINHSAGVKLRGAGKVKRTWVDEENLGLLLYTSFHNLCQEVPAMYEARATAFLTRRPSQIPSYTQEKSLSTDASSDTRQSTTEDAISKERVLDALSFHYSDSKKDIDECLKHAEVSGCEKAQLAGLIREDAFQDWLKEDGRSSVLAIHGNLDDDDGNSPISYLAAQIGKKYSKKRGFIVLSWFCSLHKDDNDAAIMARLTGQLLSQADCLLPPEDFNFISRHKYKKLKQRDLKTLTNVFSNIMTWIQSKRIIVFCLIDSLSTYETTDLRKGTEKLIEFFRDLVRSMSRRSREEMPKLIFKLLISDGQSSDLAVKYFKDREILDMDDGLDTDVDSDASLIDSN